MSAADTRPSPSETPNVGATGSPLASPCAPPLVHERVTKLARHPDRPPGGSSGAPRNLRFGRELADLFLDDLRQPRPLSRGFREAVARLEPRVLSALGAASRRVDAISVINRLCNATAGAFDPRRHRLSCVRWGDRNSGRGLGSFRKADIQVPVSHSVRTTAGEGDRSTARHLSS